MKIVLHLVAFCFDGTDMVAKIEDNMDFFSAWYFFKNLYNPILKYIAHLFWSTDSENCFLQGCHKSGKPGKPGDP